MYLPDCIQSHHSPCLIMLVVWVVNIEGKDNGIHKEIIQVQVSRFKFSVPSIQVLALKVCYSERVQSMAAALPVFGSLSTEH